MIVTCCGPNKCFDPQPSEHSRYSSTLIEAQVRSDPMQTIATAESDSIPCKKNTAESDLTHCKKQIHIGII